MRALVFRGVGDIALEDRPEPIATDGEIVVRVEAAGICGSELEAFRGASTRRVPPLVLGHELVVSRAATDTERYVVNPLFTCGTCVTCTAGARNRCPERRLLSLDRDGGHADCVAVPPSSLYPLAATVSAAEGTLVEPLATIVNALGGERESLAHRHVTVIGAGTLGLLAVALSRFWDAGSLTAIELNPERRVRATELGASSTEAKPRTQDLVIDTVGSAGTQSLALDLCRPGGIVKAIGLHSATTVLANDVLVSQELRIEGVYAYSDAHFATAVDLVGLGRLRLGSLVRTAALEEGPTMFRRLVDFPADLVKVVLEP